MLCSDQTQIRYIYTSLQDIGCCKKCTLRYLGERDINSYRSTEETINKKVYSEEITDSERTENVSKLQKRNTCVSCLGLLEEQGCGIDAVMQVCNVVNEAGYDAHSFGCTISLPVCIQLRSHSIWLYLVGKFGELYSDLKEDEAVTSMKDVWKWVMAPKIAEKINKKIETCVVCDFSIGIHVHYADDEKECSCLLEMCQETFQTRKKQKRKYNGGLYTRRAVDTAIQETEVAKFRAHFPSPPSVPGTPVYYDKITCNHASLYIAGRYNKYSRYLSQTPWMIDGEKKMETSVQELICDKIMPVVAAESSKFSASGREDVDVRTLGRGRPFVVEFVNPKRIQYSLGDLKTLQDEINRSTNDIFVRDLQVVSKEELTNLKEGEEEKTKSYTALCRSQSELSDSDIVKLQAIQDLSVQQKTPLRVLHRRPLAVRERTVHRMWAERVDKNVFRLKLKTQAGTYIKEFVHGDFGRTTPNLGMLLNTEVDILALDVEEIELDWPKQLEENYMAGYK